MSDPVEHGTAPTKTLSTDKARQGVTGHGVRYVLFFSVLGVVVSFAGLTLYYAS